MKNPRWTFVAVAVHFSWFSAEICPSYYEDKILFLSTGVSNGAHLVQK